MAFQSILVAYDFSDAAARALALADRLADKLGSAIHVVHVHPEVYEHRGGVNPGLPWPTRDQTGHYLTFLDGELVRGLQAVSLELAERARRHVLRGDPVKCLLSLARELTVELICAGSSGKNGVERVLLGSVSQDLLRESPVPVLLVP